MTGAGFTSLAGHYGTLPGLAAKIAVYWMVELQLDGIVGRLGQVTLGGLHFQQLFLIVVHGTLLFGTDCSRSLTSSIRLKIPYDKKMNVSGIKKALRDRSRRAFRMAQRTGLEPATPGVTGRYSNRLNYRCVSVGLASIELFATDCQPHGLQSWNLPYGRSLGYGAVDGTRTRDPRRDRPVF